MTCRIIIQSYTADPNHALTLNAFSSHPNHHKPDSSGHSQQTHPLPMVGHEAPLFTYTPLSISTSARTPNKEERHKSQYKRIKYTVEQLTTLESAFKINMYPTASQKEELAKQINVSKHQVHVWSVCSIYDHRQLC